MAYNLNMQLVALPMKLLSIGFYSNMEYLIENGRVRGKLTRMPSGLPELLSDITREAMRCQPPKECLLQFIIDYLHAIVVTHEKAIVAKRIIERTLRRVEDVTPGLCLCNIIQQPLDKMISLLEDCLRRQVRRKKREPPKPQDDYEIYVYTENELLDELLSRCHLSDEEKLAIRPTLIDAYNQFYKSYMAEHRDEDPMDDLTEYFVEKDNKRRHFFSLKSAAIRIQSLFRGFSTRRRLFADITNRYTMEMNNAAIKIQRFYRHYRATVGYRTVPVVQRQPITKKAIEICVSKSDLFLNEEEGEGEDQEYEASQIEKSDGDTVTEDTAHAAAAAMAGASMAESGGPRTSSTKLSMTASRMSTMSDRRESKDESSSEYSSGEDYFMEGEGEEFDGEYEAEDEGN